MREFECTESCIYEYLENVLDHYKTAADASFGEWPVEEIDWIPFTKNKFFYAITKQWFAERNINIIQGGDDSKRYLSTFILAAEFPHTLGYNDLVAELVRKYGWLSLYRAPQPFLDEYINSIIITNYALAQRQSLEINKGGYFAFLELVTILASIRYLLGNSENLEEICVKVATKTERDIGLVQRIADAYHDTLIPPLNDAHISPIPQFSFQLKQDGIWKLAIKHNLHGKTRIQMPSSIEFNRFSIGSLSCIAGEEILQINTSLDSVQLESIDNHIDLDCGIKQDHFFIQKRNESLKDIRFCLTGTDKKANMHSFTIGKIQRPDNFLVFDMKGYEIVTNSRLYRRGQLLMVVPLNLQVAQNLVESPWFRQLRLPETLPIFVLEGNPAKVEIDGQTLDFCETPFSIQLRTQTPWEQTFCTKPNFPYYFFSPLMQISLEGDFTGLPDPAFWLGKIVKIQGKKEYVPIKAEYKNKYIKPVKNFPSPGVYKLIVQFGNDVQRVQFFRLLPVRSIRLLDEKHLQIKFYAEATKFQLLGDHPCTMSVAKNLVDLQFTEYGNHQIDATYTYKKDETPVTTEIRFIFKAQQEVVGHFSRELVGINNEGLSLQKDLIPSASFEFRKNSLSDQSQRYTVSAYMEGESQHGLFPRFICNHVDGTERFVLEPYITSLKKDGYSRLLLLVNCGNRQLFRASFFSTLANILNLEKEWEKGAYNELLVVPIYSLDPYTVTDLSDIPDNSIVYGMIYDAERNPQYATHGLCLPPVSESEDPVHRLIDSFTTDISEEKVWDMLLTILTSPMLSYKLIAWYTKASKCACPNDIPAYVYLLERFPIVAAWSDLARNPKNRNEIFALITSEANFLYLEDKYLVPNGINLASNPRYSPELMTIKDIQVLERMNLLPLPDDKNVHSLITLSYFCAIRFVTGGKPVLSWLTLFWFRSYCEKHALQAAYTQFKQDFRNIPLVVTEVSQEYTRVMPTYHIDRTHEQNIRNMVIAEQRHYAMPMITKITGLFDFLDCLESSSFTSGLSSIIATRPLAHAEPDLEGFKTSSKWKFIIFLSLTVVCTQLDNLDFLPRLHDLWEFTPMQYTYLIQWANQNTATGRIYNAYYEYWMEKFWEDIHV